MINYLRKRYPNDQGWILLTEVANGTGYTVKGFCDAMALSLWPSRGIALHGFEIKASRSDLLRELQDKSKAENFIKYCDHWWLVVNDVKLVEGVALPHDWGVLAPKRGVLYQTKPAAKLKRIEWTPAFVAALMRRMYEATLQKPEQEAQQKFITEVNNRAKVLAKTQADQRVAQLERSIKALEHDKEYLKKAMDEFELKSGLKISSWNAGHVAEAVSQLMRRDQRLQLRRELSNLVTTHARLAADIRKSIIALDRLDARQDDRSASAE